MGQAGNRCTGCAEVEVEDLYQMNSCQLSMEEAGLDFSQVAITDLCAADPEVCIQISQISSEGIVGLPLEDKSLKVSKQVSDIKKAIAAEIRIPPVAQDLLFPGPGGDCVLDQSATVEELADWERPVKLKLRVRTKGPLAFCLGPQRASMMDMSVRRRSLEGQFDLLGKHMVGPKRVVCMAVDWNSSKAITGSKGLQLWDLALQECIGIFGCSDRVDDGIPEVHCVSIFCDGKKALKALSGDALGAVTLWSLLTMQSIWRIKISTRMILCLRVDWNSQVALVAGMDTKLALISTKNAANQDGDNHGQKYMVHTSWVQCLDVDWGNRRVLSGSADCTVKLWDLRDGQIMQNMTGHATIVQCLTACWDDERGISADLEGGVRLWNLVTGEVLNSFSGPTHWFCCLPVGVVNTRQIVFGSKDGTLRQFDFASGECTKEWKTGVNSLSCFAVDWKRAMFSGRITTEEDGSIVGKNGMTEDDRLRMV